MKKKRKRKVKVTIRPIETEQEAKARLLRFIQQAIRYAANPSTCILALCLFLVGCSDRIPKPEAAQVNQGELKVGVLPQPEFVQGDPWQAYLDNEAKAEATYKGKRAQTTGKVAAVHANEGRYHLVLNKAYKQGVCSCMFAQNTPELQALVKGQTVTVEGTVTDWDFVPALKLADPKIVYTGDR